MPNGAKAVDAGSQTSMASAAASTTSKHSIMPGLKLNAPRSRVAKPDGSHSQLLDPEHGAGLSRPGGTLSSPGGNWPTTSLVHNNLGHIGCAPARELKTCLSSTRPSTQTSLRSLGVPQPTPSRPITAIEGTFNTMALNNGRRDPHYP